MKLKFSLAIVVSLFLSDNVFAGGSGTTGGDHQRTLQNWAQLVQKVSSNPAGGWEMLAPVGKKSSGALYIKNSVGETGRLNDLIGIAAIAWKDGGELSSKAQDGILDLYQASIEINGGRFHRQDCRQALSGYGDYKSACRFEENGVDLKGIEKISSLEAINGIFDTEFSSWAAGISGFQ